MDGGSSTTYDICPVRAVGRPWNKGTDKLLHSTYLLLGLAIPWKFLVDFNVQTDPAFTTRRAGRLSKDRTGPSS